MDSLPWTWIVISFLAGSLVTFALCIWQLVRMPTETDDEYIDFLDEAEADAANEAFRTTDGE